MLKDDQCGVLRIEDDKLEDDFDNSKHLLKNFFRFLKNFFLGIILIFFPLVALGVLTMLLVIFLY